MQDNLKFIKSVYNCQFLPPDIGREIAFVGRSNAGKSSAISALFGKKIARVSKAPGCTPALNFFAFNDQKRLVDFPGYGFAQRSKQEQINWQILITEYFTNRQSIRNIFMFMDIRHPLQPKDQEFLVGVADYNLPIDVFLTKADKISKMQQNLVLKSTRQVLSAKKISCELLSVFFPQPLQFCGQRLKKY